MTFDVTLDSAPTVLSGPVTVNYSVADGTATAGEDYVALPSGALTFAVGETTQQVTVTVNSDFAGEFDETLFLELTGLSANANYDGSAEAIPGGIRGTGTIETSDYAPVANADINYVDFNGTAGDTVTGNVITDGAGADTLFGEGPATVATVTYDGVVYAIDGTTVITTPKGELTIQENGDYSYESTLDRDTSDGGADLGDWQQVSLYAFSAGTAYEVIGVLDLASANGTVGDGDGIGVSGGDDARIDNDNALGAEALVMELDANATTATAEIRSFGSSEEMVWVAYDENLNKVAEATVSGTGNTQDITIDTAGIPFRYIAFSVPQGIAGDEYYVHGLDYTYDDGIEDVFSYVIEDADGDLSNETTLTIVVDTAEPIGPLSDTDSDVNQVANDASAGTVVGITAQASDPDAGDTVSYSLDDDFSGTFTIDPGTGVVTVDDPTALASNGSASIVIRATSSDGSFTTQNFDINISDGTVPIAVDDSASVDESLSLIHI